MDRRNSNAVTILFEIWKFYVGLIEAMIGHKTPIQKTASMPIISYGPNGKQNWILLDVKKAVDVRANPLPYHQEQKWQRNAGVYRGYFRCRLGSFKGEVKLSSDGVYTFYIFNPPIEVLTGSHKACFSSTGNGRFHIHFRVNSNNLDGGIMSVERLLTESLSRR